MLRHRGHFFGRFRPIFSCWASPLIVYLNCLKADWVSPSISTVYVCLSSVSLIRAIFARSIDPVSANPWFLKQDQYSSYNRSQVDVIIDWVVSSVTSKKSPNVYKSCPKMISL